MSRPCPECAEPIGLTATRCRCGWRLGGQSQQSRPTVPCVRAADGCASPAVTRSDEMDFCLAHYTEHEQQKLTAQALERGYGRQAGESPVAYRERMRKALRAAGMRRGEFGTFARFGSGQGGE